MPASAWRMTAAASGELPGGVTERVELVRLAHGAGQRSRRRPPNGSVLPAAGRGGLPQRHPTSRRSRTVADSPGPTVSAVVRGDLGAAPVGVDRRRLPVDHVVVDAVLDVGAGVRVAGKEPLVVGLVLGEQQRRRRRRTVQVVRPERPDASPRPRSTPAGPSTCVSSGFSAGRASHDDQVLRNQSVGSRCSSAASGPRLAAVIADEDVVRRRPWRTRRTRRSSGRRRRRRCRAARTPARRGCAGGWSRPGRRRGRPPAGTCRATSCRSGSACCRGRSSTP